ncbi:MAG: ATP-dependent DNA helicase RecG, partial [Candidatus Falkowbacteria bacterium]
YRYMITLRTAISELSRVGQTTAKRLFKLDIFTVEDLLWHLPFRYDEFGAVVPIGQVQAGQNACVVGRVELIQNKRSPRRRLNITEALISDDSGQIRVVWFNQPFVIKNLPVGSRVSLAGKVESDWGGELLHSPAYELLSATGTPIHTQGIIPHYHTTLDITQRQLRYLIKQVLPLAAKLEDWLPMELVNAYGLLPLAESLTEIHFPKNQARLARARHRLAFNELLFLQLQAQQSRSLVSHHKAVPIAFDERSTKALVTNLPFQLTDGQRKSAWQIITDLAKTKPMTRLLEGDVGSGKTVVAALAMHTVVKNGYQAALMVPTEILAQQHFTSLQKSLVGSGVRLALVTSSDRRSIVIGESDEISHKKNAVQTMVEEADIIIGTHALIQEGVNFSRLALVVVDEQHRFGVEQRQKLVNQGSGNTFPHLLSMTATPIPRSLALALYGDLDISVLRELPKGRKSILTKLITEDQRQKAYEFIRTQIKQGRQAFVVCPLIDPADTGGMKSAKEEQKKLQEEIFTEFKIGLLHGKMKSAEKEKAMRAFMQNELHILVATSVVEVGVDVPNASIMMIEGADRFGLAQLHQFRGRVGRGEAQSYCFLLSESNAPQTLQRLEAMVAHQSGFDLAKIDLELRGPGEVYGSLQKGFPELEIASLFDYEIMSEAKEAAEKLLRLSPDLSAFTLLQAKVGEFQANVHLE